MLSERTRVRVRAHGKDEDAVAGSKESLGRPKQRGVLGSQFIGQRPEIVIGQTNDQEHTGDDIHDLAVFVVQRPVWLHAVELAIIVADDCDGVCSASSVPSMSTISGDFSGSTLRIFMVFLLSVCGAGEPVRSGLHAYTRPRPLGACIQVKKFDIYAFFL